MRRPILAAALLALLSWVPARLEAAAEFSGGNAAALLKHLVLEIGPRPMGSPAERRALEFAAAKLLEYGCDTAYVMPMTRASAVNTASGVAVGVLGGRSGRTIVIGAHIDSAGPEIPGANDDGSGTAVVLETARILKQRERESTIVFALFGGEEQGLEGSEHFVANFARIDSVVLMLQVDMVNGMGKLIMDPNAHGASAPAWLVRAAAEEMRILDYPGLTYPTHYFAMNYSLPSGSGSDHEPFLRAGIPAIDFTTSLDDPIHTPQDSWENFDASGLKRSGDLVLRLAERFDGGVPGRHTEEYWAYLLLGSPVIVPRPFVWAFVLLAPAAGLLALLRLRRHHAVLRAQEGYAERRWTSLKFLLVCLAMAAAGWMAPDVIGLVKGARYPWYSHPRLYYILSLLAAAFVLFAAARLAPRLKISPSPYVLFKRSFIALTLIIGLTAAAGVNIAVGPAVCLFLLAAAPLLPSPFTASVCTLIAPFWMFRLLFSEADTLLFRWTAPQLPGTFAVTAIVNCVWIVVLAALLFAWLPGAAAVIRRRDNPWPFLGAVRLRRFMVISAGLFVLYGVALVLVPAYEHPWYPDVHIEEVDRPGGGRDTLTVRGSEYLGGASLRYGETDTLLEGRTLGYTALLPLRSAEEDTADGWAEVERVISREPGDSATVYDVRLRIRTRFRPYTVAVTYASSRGTAPRIETPLRSRERGGVTRIAWYAFPDTVLEVPVKFSVAAGDTIREEVAVTFDTLRTPVDFRYRKANVFLRTVAKSAAEYPGAR